MNNNLRNALARYGGVVDEDDTRRVLSVQPVWRGFLKSWDEQGKSARDEVAHMNPAEMIKAWQAGHPGFVAVHGAQTRLSLCVHCRYFGGALVDDGEDTRRLRKTDPRLLTAPVADASCSHPASTSFPDRWWYSVSDELACASFESDLARMLYLQVGIAMRIAYQRFAERTPEAQGLDFEYVEEWASKRTLRQCLDLAESELLSEPVGSPAAARRPGERLRGDPGEKFERQRAADFFRDLAAGLPDAIGAGELDVLHRATRDADAAVRLAAVQALGLLKRTESLATIEGLLREETESAWVRSAADEARRAIQGTLDPRSARFLRDPSSFIG
jgi:hypothetical protein